MRFLILNNYYCTIIIIEYINILDMINIFIRYDIFFRFCSYNVNN